MEFPDLLVTVKQLEWEGQPNSWGFTSGHLQIGLIQTLEVANAIRRLTAYKMGVCRSFIV